MFGAGGVANEEACDASFFVQIFFQGDSGRPLTVEVRGARTLAVEGEVGHIVFTKKKKIAKWRINLNLAENCPESNF